jgi:5-(hydroxymethyl)furfural/furfural oxidase
MDGPAPLRRSFVSATITGGKTLEGLVSDNHALESFVRENVSFGWHGCGSCRMGGENDPGSVVDPKGRVHKIRGLRVADASIMPEIPRANIAIPTIMLAEKISDYILEDHDKERNSVGVK